MAMNKEKISIVIPALNEEKNIENLLLDISVQNKSYDGSDFELEVLVADANSKDRTKMIAESYGARVIEGGLPGYARNKGARAASGSVVYFMDADVRFEDSDFLKKSFEEFTRRGLHCAGMNNYLWWKGDESPALRSRTKIIFDISNLYTKAVQKTKNPVATGTCMMADRESFLDIGGFDEKIYWGEDSELAQRFARSGCNFGILRSVSIIASSRKAVAHGPLTYARNALKLHTYRKKHGEISSKEIYGKVTGIGDYFARAE